GVPGFSLWKRYFSRNTRIMLGPCMSKAWQKGHKSNGNGYAEVPAMYFVIVKARSEKENLDVDVGDIRLERDVAGKMLCATSWKIVSHFRAGDDIYVDRRYTVEKLPSFLSGKNVMLVQTAQDDKLSQGRTHCQFAVFQPSNVFLCYDQRAQS
ncbi:unnamed protein product, partial [Chrysoparadoxa australica]